MYFFRTLLLILMIVMISISLYRYLKNSKLLENNEIFLLYLLIIQILFIIFNTNIIFIVFMDFPCLLGYILHKNREAFALSLLSVIYLILFLELPILYYLIYLGYFIIFIIFSKNKKNLLTYLIIFKSFYTSFMYFLYINKEPVNIIYVLFIILYFYCLLKLIYKSITNYQKTKDDQLISKMAHEIKNPLTICKGYLDMLNINDRDKVEKYTPIIKSEVDRTLAIINDFLSLKKISVKKEIMDLCMLLEDTKNTMESILKENKVKLKIKENRGEVLINGDYEKLKQVIINALKNSCEANAKKIKLEIDVAKDKAILIIEDNGDGISSEDLEKIGNLFYTTKSRGTGIGVNISTEIIRKHSGSIEYNSELGKGTRVIINLPCIIE